MALIVEGSYGHSSCPVRVSQVSMGSLSCCDTFVKGSAVDVYLPPTLNLVRILNDLLPGHYARTLPAPTLTSRVWGRVGTPEPHRYASSPSIPGAHSSACKLESCSMRNLDPMPGHYAHPVATLTSRLRGGVRTQARFVKGCSSRDARSFCILRAAGVWVRRNMNDAQLQPLFVLRIRVSCMVSHGFSQDFTVVGS